MDGVSKEFLGCVTSNGGQLVVECACGVTHFAGTEDHYEDAIEFDVLISRSVQYPLKYIHHPESDCVYEATLNGVLYVVDCPCKKLKNIEDLFWRLKDRLLEYYRLRLQKMKDECDNMGKSLESLI